jgi:hypothetical protein
MCQQWVLPLVVRTYFSTTWCESQDPIRRTDLMIELTGSANICHRRSARVNWPRHHSSEGATMWQICFAVFVILAAIFVAVALLQLVIYGGGQDDARG